MGSTMVHVNQQPYQQHQQVRNNQYTNNGQYHTNNNSNKKKSSGYKGFCQLCDKKGHTAKECSDFTSRRNGPSANHTSTLTVPTSNWLIDSAASHHITRDLQNLAIHNPYNGTDSVLIGNGTGLGISHTGSTFLPSTRKPFHLNNVLCVPSRHKNLICLLVICFL